MPRSNRQQGLFRANIVLTVLLIGIIGLQIGLASIRYPAGPRYGDTVRGGTPGQVESGVLAVGTYNIHRGKGLDGKRDLGRIAKNLQQLDIVGLNEVGGAFLPDHDDAAALGQLLNTGWLFAPSQRRWYIDYFGNGLLSRVAPLSWQSLPMIHDLDENDGHRNLLYVDYELAGTPFTVIVFHAENNHMKDAQITVALREFERYERAILMGDFNAENVKARLAPMLSSGKMLSVGAREPNDVDWIFTKGFRVVDEGRVAPGASDHPLVWARLALDEDKR